MKTIRILHMFPKLLSLYGEYGNLSVLKMTLEAAGCTVELIPYENGELTLEGFDLVYMGSGTEDNLLEAAKRLAPHKEAICASIENGTPWLVTGNAPALFGKSLQIGKTQAPALEAFGYTTQIDPVKRYIGDVLAKDAQGQWYVGFVNNANVYTGMENTWLELALNPKLGNDKQTAAEGLRHRNFTATGLIGPILAKNPHMLAALCRELTGEELTLDPNSNICKAFDTCLFELQNRLKQEN